MMNSKQYNRYVARLSPKSKVWKNTCFAFLIGGAGTLVPITGFANAMVSPALEFRREGLVLGLGAKLFSIAGPVLVYGIGASVLVGVVYALFFR